jgi:carboxyl-terminal processing protease
MDRRRGCWRSVGLVVVALVVGLAGGVVLDRQLFLTLRPPIGIPADAVPEFHLMAEAWNLVIRVYVDRSAIVGQRLAYGAIGGLVNALGDTGHSRFLTPTMVRREQDYSQGKYEGIGSSVEMKDGHVIIAAATDGSPAQKAGLRPGDIILKVDGQSVAGMTLDDVVAKVKGPVGTSVTLQILHPATGTVQDYTLKRAEIEVHNVTWARVPGTAIAHVRIAGFSQGVSDELQQALQEIQQENPVGLILDLRNDPGGLLDEAVGVASHFLTTGNVLLEKDAQGEITPVPVQETEVVTNLPMVVLVNGGTASAAEIVTGALQDAQRATVVGEVTFGTGTVLGEFQLSDGSALFLAISEWLTPKGRTIWHQGLDPDISVSLPPDGTPLYPAMERQMQADQIADSSDTQLLEAVHLLAPQ